MVPARHSLRKVLRFLLPLLLLAAVLLLQSVPGAGEWYARHLYPAISLILSGIACPIPISLTELLVVIASLRLVLYPFLARRKASRQKWSVIARKEIFLLVWIYIWFYIGWGLNYSRDDFHVRSGIPHTGYDSTAFHSFLADYTAHLNAAYRMQEEIPSFSRTEAEIKALYRRLPPEFGLTAPRDFQHPKRSIANFLHSKTGVLGFMGPFFAESHLNRQLLPVQVPFTYAHELSHLLGVSSEAEANFWAWYICTSSSDDYIRYSGYMGLFSFVASNARRLLSPEQYRSWITGVDPGIIAEHNGKNRHWNALYSTTLGAFQNRIYNLYLKGNKIPSGTRNYSQVMEIVLSIPPGTDLFHPERTAVDTAAETQHDSPLR